MCPSQKVYPTGTLGGARVDVGDPVGWVVCWIVIGEGVLISGGVGGAFVVNGGGDWVVATVVVMGGGGVWNVCVSSLLFFLLFCGTELLHLPGDKQSHMNPPGVFVHVSPTAQAE